MEVKQKILILFFGMLVCLSVTSEERILLYDESFIKILKTDKDMFKTFSLMVKLIEKYNKYNIFLLKKKIYINWSTGESYVAKSDMIKETKNVESCHVELARSLTVLDIKKYVKKNGDVFVIVWFGIDGITKIHNKYYYNRNNDSYEIDDDYIGRWKGHPYKLIIFDMLEAEKRYLERNSKEK